MHKLERAAMLYEALHKRIGYLCATFADIDMRLSEILVLMINEKNPVVGSIIVDTLSFAKDVELLQRLAPEVLDLDEDESKQLGCLIENLREVAKNRNDVVHSRWYLPDADRLSFKKEGPRHKRRQASDKEDILLTKVTDLCSRADAVSNDLDEFKTAYWGWR